MENISGICQAERQRIVVLQNYYMIRMKRIFINKKNEL